MNKEREGSFNFINLNFNLVNSNNKMNNNVHNIINISNSNFNSNSNFISNIIIGNYDRTYDALRGLSGAENYVKQASSLESEEIGLDAEELMFCDTQIGNLECLGGGGEILADAHGNIDIKNELVNYDPTSRSYRIERTNRARAELIEKEQAHWDLSPNSNYPYKKSPIVKNRR
jgi:hypothetical protein